MYVLTVVHGSRNNISLACNNLETFFIKQQRKSPKYKTSQCLLNSQENVYSAIAAKYNRQIAKPHKAKTLYLNINEKCSKTSVSSANNFIQDSIE